MDFKSTILDPCIWYNSLLGLLLLGLRLRVLAERVSLAGARSLFPYFESEGEAEGRGSCLMRPNG